MALPTYDNLFDPLIVALHKLGGSGSVLEIEEEVAEILKLSDEEINEVHRGNRTKLSYRLAWARTYLKAYGLLENSTRGIWALTSVGSTIKTLDKSAVLKKVRTMRSDRGESIEEEVEEGKEPEDSEKLWQDEVIEQLLKLSPSAFEKFSQRILRESGFIQVEVTGKTGDGGIDGKGIMRIGDFLSFPIVFQCKRYTGSVPVKEIRDFRGATMGRADKGLFITTGTFTKDSRTEASRDGALRIDLIDGEALAEKIKELRLGVSVRKEEVVSVDKGWFSALSDE